MAQEPVRFVCPACGADASAFVNELVRRELGLDAAGPAAAAPLSNSPAATPIAPVARPTARMVTHTPPPAVAAPAPAAPVCSKHPGQLAVENCRVCSRPICPQCMRLFGYVCSPLCKAKAEAKGILVPAYAGMTARVEARHWRKVARVSWAISLVVLAVLGAWFWYAWFGSRPRAQFAIRFPEAAYSGRSVLMGNDQIVFLHGGQLARCDMRTKKQAWSAQLIDDKEIDAMVAAQIKEMQAAAERALQTDPDRRIRAPSPDRLKTQLERAAAAALELRAQGHNIWVASPGKISRYDWETGKKVKELAAPGGLIPQGNELLALEAVAPGQARVTRIDLDTGDLKTEIVGGPNPGAGEPSAAAGSVSKSLTASSGRGKELAGLPVGVPGRDAGKAMDPSKVAQQAQRLSLPARLALPVTLANSQSQERALAEMSDAAPNQPARRDPPESAETVSLVPTRDGFLRFAVRLVERKMVTHSAMKAAPATSVLNGEITADKSADLANEMLNDMQRARGGDVVEEDESRYQAQVLPLAGGEGWTGEMIGPPVLFPLQTVVVAAANKSLVVLDKSARKLWEGTLNYKLNAGAGAWSDENSVVGQGPCVEHKGGLYVFDQGVLTVFDLATGKVRWSLPSVGITGLFFDDQDMLYVNSTTAGLDAIKYSRQIDISNNPKNVALKIDSRTGKILWNVHPGGLISYVSGKFIYTVHSFTPEEEDPDGPPPVVTGFEPQAHLSIKRLDPGTGRQLWEHFEERSPLDVRFDHNIIHLVFRKEVEVLKFLTL